MDLREFGAADGDRLRTFWLACGIAIRPGDDDVSLVRFASRPDNVFTLAEQDARIVGSILAGWDGRRGWLYHVAVHPDERLRGIGRTLVEHAEARLRERGCPKVNLIVVDSNERAMRFWERVGYSRAKTVEYEKDL